MPGYVYTSEQWREVFSRLPAPQSAELAIANRLISDLLGYRKNSIYREIDAENLATALVAYAQLLQEHGVKA